MGKPRHANPFGEIGCNHVKALGPEGFRLFGRTGQPGNPHALPEGLSGHSQTEVAQSTNEHVFPSRPVFHTPREKYFPKIIKLYHNRP